MLKMDISEIRLKNAQHLAESTGGISAFAEKLGKSQPQISCLIGKKPSRKIGSKIAREIEVAFKLEKDWLDHTHLELWEDPKKISFLPIQTEKPEKIEETTYGLSQEAIEFAKKWQSLLPEQKALLEQTAKTLISANQKSDQQAA